MKRLLLSLLLLPPFIQGMELVPVSCANDVRLLTNHKHMYVEDENAAYRVAPHDMNRELRDVLKHKALAKFKAAGYIRAHKQSDGTYTLAAKVRGEAGGWLTGQIAAWTFRTVAYSTYAVVCVVHPELLLEAEVAHAAIETAAIGAQVVGEALPTP